MSKWQSESKLNRLQQDQDFLAQLLLEPPQDREGTTSRYGYRTYRPNGKIRHTRPTRYFAVVLVLALLVGAASIYLRLTQVNTAPALTPTPASSVADVDNQVIAEAKVVPTRSVALSLPIGGTVAEVRVAEGDQVRAGQVLARLDTTQQRARVTDAEAKVGLAQASYDKLRAGATPEEIVAAEAGLALADAQAGQASGSVTEEDLAAANAQIQSSQEQLDRLLAGPKETDLRAAEAQLAQAQANLSAQRDQLSAAKTNAQLAIDQAANQLIQAQATYSTAKWNWEHVQASGTDPVHPSVPDPSISNLGHTKANHLNDVQKQQYADALTQAEAALRNAESAVQQAQVGYDTARQAEVTGIAAAEQQMREAQANLDRVRAGADPDQISAAQAQLANAQARLSQLSGAPRYNALAVAQAGVDQARANLDRVQASMPESELAVSRAQVQSAKAELELAKIALSETTLTAPFAATVVTVDLKAQEYVAPGMSVVALADGSAWQIETNNLNELNVVKIHEGAPATIMFDALPGVTLPGKVTHIKGFGENRQGDITYVVIITPDRWDPRLRWNMTATVSITT
jgi:HlyD family secretion protein